MAKKLHLQMDYFCHFKFCHSRTNNFCCKWIPFLGLDSKVYLLQKKETLFLLSSTKTLPTHEKKKKNCLGAAKWKKSLVIMEKNETLSL